MTKLKVKQGVQLDGLREPAVRILWAAMHVWLHHAEPELAVTSAVRSWGVPGTVHPEGLALDLRRWTETDPAELVRDMELMLGHDFDILLEADHIHAEWDPVHVTGAADGR